MSKKRQEYANFDQYHNDALVSVSVKVVKLLEMAIDDLVQDDSYDWRGLNLEKMTAIVVRAVLHILNYRHGDDIVTEVNKFINSTKNQPVCDDDNHYHPGSNATH